MNVICYKRVSTDEQADRGHSLQHQEVMLTKYCEINNHDIVEIYTEDYSGKSFNRPEWIKIMSFIKKMTIPANVYNDSGVYCTIQKGINL
jgi:site-specific DNA recombinase